MDIFDSINAFAQDQIDKINAQQSIKRLNDDIVKLKNFVAKHKPSPHGRRKSIEASKQYQRELKEWDELMRL